MTTRDVEQLRVVEREARPTRDFKHVALFDEQGNPIKLSVAQKPEVQALTEDSTLADVIAALKA